MNLQRLANRGVAVQLVGHGWEDELAEIQNIYESNLFPTRVQHVLLYSICIFFQVSRARTPIREAVAGEDVTCNEEEREREKQHSRICVLLLHWMGRLCRSTYVRSSTSAAARRS